MADNSAVYNLLISAEFQQINDIRKKLYWSSFYMAGFDIYNPSPGYMSNGDPRGTTGFADFAVENVIPLYYLYAMPSDDNTKGYVINFTKLPDAAKTINEGLFEMGQHKEIEPIIKKEMIGLIAGASYFNKLVSSNTANCTYKTKNNQTESLNICTGLADRITDISGFNKFKTDNAQEIEDSISNLEDYNNGTSDTEFADTRGFIVSSDSTHASKDLIQQYNETQKRYNELINSIYKAAADTTDLTLCINNAFIGSIESSSSSPSYVDIDQVNYCGEGAKANQERDEKLENMSNEIARIKQKINTIIIILEIIIIMLISIFAYKLYKSNNKYNNLY